MRAGSDRYSTFKTRHDFSFDPDPVTGVSAISGYLGLFENWLVPDSLSLSLTCISTMSFQSLSIEDQIFLLESVLDERKAATQSHSVIKNGV